MRILVIDDKQDNLDAAVQQLQGHEVITVSSYDEAEKYIAGSLEHIGDNGRWKQVHTEEGERINHTLDVILTDLFLPASKTGVSNYNGTEEVPYGLVISMTAQRLGIPVAIVTDTNHHAHPILWAMDMMLTDESTDMQGKFEFRPGFCSFKGKKWDVALKALLS
jgi:CheY-like chemotaxis protein